MEEALRRVGPLPDEVRGAVDREWSGWFARYLVSDVLFSPAPAQEATEVLEDRPWPTCRKPSESSCSKSSETAFPSTTSIRPSRS